MYSYSFPNYEVMSEQIAADIFRDIQESRCMKVGISTGFSPALAYNFIGDYLRNQPDERCKIQVVQLDEWLGLSPEKPSSCYYNMKTNVIDNWSLHSDQVVSIDGRRPEDSLRSMLQYFKNERLGVCVSGLGRNGHLALNEPGSQKNDPCRIVKLHKMSQGHQLLSNLENKPLKGITIGIKEILESKKIVLIVTGKEKKEAFSKFTERRISSQCPVTFLHLHPNLHCYIDESSLA